MSEGFRVLLPLGLVDPGSVQPITLPSVSVGIRLPDWGQEYIRRKMGPGGSYPAGGQVVGGGTAMSRSRLADWGQEYIRREIEGR